MIDKLKTGVWKKAQAVGWENGEYVVLRNDDGYLTLLMYEASGSVVAWTLNMKDSLNMKFKVKK